MLALRNRFLSMLHGPAIMAQKVIHVGVGVFGKRWCTEFLKTNVADGTIDVVAVVDRDPAALEYGRQALGLPRERCYPDARRAFAETRRTSARSSSRRHTTK